MQYLSGRAAASCKKKTGVKRFSGLQKDSIYSYTKLFYLEYNTALAATELGRIV